MRRCLCWVLGAVNQCKDRERIFFLSCEEFDLQEEHVVGGSVAGQPRNPCLSVTSPRITSHSSREARHMRGTSKALHIAASSVHKLRYTYSRTGFGIMGSSLPCKYGKQRLGYETPHPFCHLLVRSSTGNSYTNQTCALRCC
jgi:hypothetical protein